MTNDEALINEYVQEFVKDREAHQLLADTTERGLKTLLRENDIRAMTTSRAKYPQIFRQKLLHRKPETGISTYKTYKDIREDIGDLAGVRVGVFLFSEIAKVERLIRRNFGIVRKCVLTGRRKATSQEDETRPSGYSAMHLRVRPDGERMVEIQIASIRSGDFWMLHRKVSGLSKSWRIPAARR